MKVSDIHEVIMAHAPRENVTEGRGFRIDPRGCVCGWWLPDGAEHPFDIFAAWAGHVAESIDELNWCEECTERELAQLTIDLIRKGNRKGGNA